MLKLEKGMEQVRERELGLGHVRELEQEHELEQVR